MHADQSALCAHNMRLSGHYAHAQISDKMRVYEEVLNPASGAFLENCDGFMHAGTNSAGVDR